MANPKKWTADRIRAAKGRQRLACLTAYDFSMARLLDAAGIPLILVGDSLGMTVLGHATTLPVTIEQMLHHTAAVARGVKSALVVADLPFLSYQISPEQALANAGKFVQEAGADAVKLEGGALRVETVRRLVENGIPVMGHVGLTPQSVRTMGGYRIQGRTAEAARRILADARALAGAGVFSIVLEGIPAELGREITAAVGVPTIGIGAGSDCDGQILVLHDVLGLSGDFAPKFVRRYADLGAAVEKAAAEYRRDVEEGRFPGKAESY